jgi:hypothetical protein
MNDEQEILVHISTSVTRQKDDVYRSLADAYLEFEPCAVHSGSSPGPSSPSLEMTLVVPDVTTSRDSYGSFPSHIESGDLSSSQKQADTQISSSLHEESQLHTSRLGRLEQLHMRWKQTSSRACGQRSVGAPPSSTLEDGAFIDNTQLAYQAMQSQLFDALSATSEDTSEDESGPVETSLAEPTENPHMAHVIEEPTMVVSPRNFEADLTISRPTIPETSTRHSILSKQNPFQEQPSASKAQRPNFQGLPSEIFPPAPTITVQVPRRLPSQITKFLETLKIQNPNRYKPRRNRRSLDHDERGCWIVDNSTWPSAVQFEFWTSLADHVSSGRLGWGVTLHRDILRPHELGLVHLFCWGEIVEHIWLALWLCSGGRISGSGSSWMDAEESVVIEVSAS